jgi:hypothetical protein
MTTNREQNPTKEPTPYRVYILRSWQEAKALSKEESVWRFSLEDPNTHQRRGFPNLEMLVAFLENETGRNSDNE